ncbi:MAG: DUF2158 domain-containing protein [Bacteroidia bacterium]|jgi:hypothetical protein
MENKIKVGDIVKINMKNSPEMKVEKIVRLKALCYWFDKNKTLQNQLFFLKDLIVLNPD